MGQHGRGVGRDEILPRADGHEQRRAPPRRDDRVGLARRYHRDAVCALDLVQRPRDRFDQRAGAGKQLLDQVREHLRVGLGAEHVTALPERGAQRAGVLDDAVVDQRQGTAAVGVRVRVDGVGRAVRGPAGVGDPCVPGGKVRSECLLEHTDLPRRLVHLDTAALEQERSRLPRPRVAYDAAHTRRASSTSSWAPAPDGASAINRMIGSVFDGRTWSQRSRQARRRPSSVSTWASAKRRRSAAYTGSSAGPRATLAFTIAYRGAAATSSLTRLPSRAGRVSSSAAATGASRPACRAGYITPPFPSPPITAPSRTMARATWTSPTGVRTTSAPQSRAASSTTRLVERLQTTDGDRVFGPPVRPSAGPPSTARTANASI